MRPTAPGGPSLRLASTHVSHVVTEVTKRTGAGQPAVMPMTSKTFTADTDTPTVRFTVEFQTGAGTVDHAFNARPKLSLKTIKRFAGAQDDKSGKIVLELEKVIRANLVDDDGTPASWKYDPDTAVPSGPDGDELTRGQAAKMAEFEHGSSRRRWDELMADDDVDMDLAQIQAILEFLVEQASDRPTSRSSR